MVLYVLILLQDDVALQWRHNGRDSVSNHLPHQCLFRRRSKKTSKLRVTGLCAGNSPETGEFPTQMANNAENVSIWWRHHGACYSVIITRSAAIKRNISSASLNDIIRSWKGNCESRQSEQLRRKYIELCEQHHVCYGLAPFRAYGISRLSDDHIWVPYIYGTGTWRVSVSVVPIPHMSYWSYVCWFAELGHRGDHSGYGLSQWQTTLQCNVVFHWLSP